MTTPGEVLRETLRALPTYADKGPLRDAAERAASEAIAALDQLLQERDRLNATVSFTCDEAARLRADLAVTKDAADASLRLDAENEQLRYLLASADPNDPAWLQAKRAALSHQGEPTCPNCGCLVADHRHGGIGVCSGGHGCEDTREPTDRCPTCNTSWVSNRGPDEMPCRDPWHSGEPTDRPPPVTIPVNPYMSVRPEDAGIEVDRCPTCGRDYSAFGADSFTCSDPWHSDHATDPDGRAWHTGEPTEGEHEKTHALARLVAHNPTHHAGGDDLHSHD